MYGPERSIKLRSQDTHWCTAYQTYLSRGGTLVFELWKWSRCINLRIYLVFMLIVNNEYMTLNSPSLINTSPSFRIHVPIYFQVQQCWANMSNPNEDNTFHQLNLRKLSILTSCFDKYFVKQMHSSSRLVHKCHAHGSSLVKWRYTLLCKAIKCKN